MMRRLRSLLRDECGASLVEATLVLPMLLILTFGLIEVGHALWQYHAAEKATAAGVRFLATRHGVKGLPGATAELYTATVPDCFVNNSSATPGTPCTQFATAPSWSQTCSGSGGGACDATVMAALLAQMQRYAPFLSASNVTVTFRGSTMGFVGRGRAVPLITVSTSGLTYDFVALGDLLGVGPITMPGFDSTLVAEDQKEGAGT